MDSVPGAAVAVKRVFLIGAAVVALMQLSDPPASPIVIDGAFDDWRQVGATRDGPDAGNSALDFADIRVTGDDRFIAVLVDIVHPAESLNAVPGSFVILLDQDGTASTGRSVHGMAGIDLEIVGNARGKGGWDVRRQAPGGGVVEESPYAIRLAVAPKFRSSRFEIRFERQDRAPSHAARALVKLVYLEDTVVRDEAGPVAIPLPPQVTPASPGPDDRVPPEDPLQRAPGTALRVVAWNVARLPSRKPADGAATVFRALDPDLVMLNELAAPSTKEVAALLPARADGGAAAWHLSMHGEVAVAVRGSVEDVFVPPLMPLATGFYDTLSELLFGRSRIAAMGAVTTVSNHRIFTIPLHLACCGAQATRAIEAAIILSEIQQGRKRANAAAVIVAGDLNLLGSPLPLETLKNGTNPDGSPLAAVEPLQLNGLSNETWRSIVRGNRKGLHVPSRLDWILYSPWSLELRRAFVFDARDLAPYWLRRHGLAADATDRTSDHLALVADFAWRH